MHNEKPGSWACRVFLRHAIGSSGSSWSEAAGARADVPRLSGNPPRYIFQNITGWREPIVDKPIKPKLRILLGAQIAIGPGKADLLDAVARTGSISAAAREMGMSYRRAWMLVDTMNRCFHEPLVEASKGGSGGGGARVTDLGLEVLARYRAMEVRAAASVATEMREFARLLAERED
jgi:molybdate transport system regulatory protein